jgi:hypothetical protein
VHPQLGANFASRFFSREAAKKAKEKDFCRITADPQKKLRLRISATPREIPYALPTLRSLPPTPDAPREQGASAVRA